MMMILIMMMMMMMIIAKERPIIEYLPAMTIPRCVRQPVLDKLLRILLTHNPSKKEFAISEVCSFSHPYHNDDDDDEDD